MSSIKRFRQAGFTIVELLVVIAVIAILAGITVVAYNGVQAGARNSARIAAASQSQKAVSLAISKYSAKQVLATLYSDGSWERACVGVGHPDLDGNGVGDCGRYQSQPPYVFESAAFNTMLSNVTSVPNMSAYPRNTSTDGDVVTGPWVEDMIVDSKNALVLEYYLEGPSKDCTLQRLVYGGSGSRTLTKPGSNYQYSSTTGGLTECRVYLGDI